ncbi:DMT family transporter [candidate division KSB1 bacterium]|nr:DMT family transporter [candidate division KSB1 bacterium]
MATIPHFGELLALSTALIWAFAVILFKKSGETVHPIALNLFKNVLGAGLLVPTIWLFEGSFMTGLSVSEVNLLLISGALGIGIADTLFFMSLNRLGAALSSIVDCLYSPLVIAAAMIWLGERLRLWQVVGVVLIISAVLEATHTKQADHAVRRGLWWGVLWGVLAMAFMAVGIVMVKPLLETSSLLWVMEIRLLGGIATLLVILLFNRERLAILRSLLVRGGWGYMVSGSFVGAYLALFTWLAGMKYTQASQASALNQTSNVFVFVFAAIFLKERMTRQRVIGIGLAVVGVWLVTFL